MGAYDVINIKITGQVKPCGDGRLVIAELNLIVAKYGLDMDVSYDEDLGE